MAKTTTSKEKAKGKTPSKDKVKKSTPEVKVEETPTLAERHKEYIETITADETIIEPATSGFHQVEKIVTEYLPIDIDVDAFKIEVAQSEEPTEEAEADHVEHIEFKQPIKHKFVEVDGNMGRVEYSDGSSELMTFDRYEKLRKSGELVKQGSPIKSTPLVKSKEEADLEAHYASLGQIDYYIKHIKK